MNMGSLDIFLTVAALVAGVMLLTGHGDVFMKGGNASERKKLYDEKKVQKGDWNCHDLDGNCHWTGHGSG